MKAIIEVPLRTREVYMLFERKLDGKRLFLEAVQHKINKLIRKSKEPNEEAARILNDLQEKIENLTHYFATEITRFEQILNQKKEFQEKTIQIIVQFRPALVLYSYLSTSLVHFLDSYDKLLATLKLLHLGGCFASVADYFYAKKTYQKMANQLLGVVIIIPSASAKSR